MSAGGYCKDCFSGTIHDGTPTGRMEKMYGLDTYIADAPSESSNGIIVIIPDAFGLKLNNNKILADNFARKSGCKVLIPDFFLGNDCDYVLMDYFDVVLSPTASYFSKLTNVLGAMYHGIPFAYANREGITKPRVYNFFRALRHDNPSTKIGAAGYCWGGKFTTYLCAGWNNPSLDPYPSNNVDIPEASKDKEEYLIDAGYTAHPSQMTIPRDVQSLRKPLSIANGTKDFQMTVPKMEEVQRAFEERKQKGEGPECELVVYEGAKHGFAVRWNPKDEREQKQGEESEEQAVRWFKKHFGAKL